MTNKPRFLGEGQSNAEEDPALRNLCTDLFAACCKQEPCTTVVNLVTPAAGGPNSNCDEPPCAGGGNPFNRDLVEAKEDDCLNTDSCLPGSRAIYVFSNIGEDGESASDLFLKDFTLQSAQGLVSWLPLLN